MNNEWWWSKTNGTTLSNKINGLKFSKTQGISSTSNVTIEQCTLINAHLRTTHTKLNTQRRLYRVEWSPKNSGVRKTLLAKVIHHVKKDTHTNTTHPHTLTQTWSTNTHTQHWTHYHTYMYTNTIDTHI